VPDPKRVGFSPFIGMGNNPIKLIDPDGGAPVDDYHIDDNGNIINIVETTDNFDRVIKNGEEVWRTEAGTFLKDVTVDFNNILESTKEYFTVLGKKIDSNYDPNNLESQRSKFYYKLQVFRNNVNDRAKYDIKANGFGIKELGYYSIYKNQLFRYDDYGNYNYGVAARAFGLSLSVAELGAGINQLSKAFGIVYYRSKGLILPTIERTNIPLGSLDTYFDEKYDNLRIIQGYKSW
jgi:hypothetical protein